MTLLETLHTLRKNAERVCDRLDTEEATKNALVMPFLRALGFDPFDPDIVVPEFTADVGTKKGEKVDYALKKDGQLIALVECKNCGCKLQDAYFNQLFRYFSVTTARVGILTNGVDYWFFTDIDEKNKLDARPFYRFSLADFSESDARQIEAFSARKFDNETLDQTASVLKYASLIKNEIRSEIAHPSDEIIRMLTKRVYSGHYTTTVREQFEPLVAAALAEIIKEMVNTRLTHALSQVNAREEDSIEAIVDEAPVSEIVTTDEELEAFLIIKSMGRRFVDMERIVMRDHKSYCNVLLDNNNRKPIVRFYFDGATKRVSFGREPEKFVLKVLDELFNYEQRLRETIASYDVEVSR